MSASAEDGSWRPEAGTPVVTTAGGAPVATAGGRSPALARPDPANLADVLERVLDKGIVIAGDIRINLVDIELLTIRVRLLVASVDRAREMGIDWWAHDPMLSSRASDRLREQDTSGQDTSGQDTGGQDTSDA
jgi:hypothetical protein